MPEPGRVAAHEWWWPGSTDKPGPNAANRGRSSEMVIVVRLLRWLEAGIALGSPIRALIFGRLGTYYAILMILHNTSIVQYYTILQVMYNIVI
jgi:hypothetical protein